MSDRDLLSDILARLRAQDAEIKAIRAEQAEATVKAVEARAEQRVAHRETAVTLRHAVFGAVLVVTTAATTLAALAALSGGWGPLVAAITGP